MRALMMGSSSSRFSYRACEIVNGFGGGRGQLETLQPMVSSNLYESSLLRRSHRLRTEPPEGYFTRVEVVQNGSPAEMEDRQVITHRTATSVDVLLTFSMHLY